MTNERIAERIKEIYQKDEKYWKLCELVTPELVKSTLIKIFQGHTAVDTDELDYGTVLTDPKYDIRDKESATLELLIAAGWSFTTSIDHWLESKDEYESFSDSYTLPDGQTVYVEGYYGYN